ncbi:hypothetical protein CCMA1212_009007 [Trichoderma ghanense]|uniref:Uncharacterized protein n=1 Tax=Trichoderma ghanense TaxID=65468 RepID=A0ABY2GV25_9HYPO
MQQQYTAFGAELAMQQPQNISAQKHQWMARGARMAMQQLQLQLHLPEDFFEQNQQQFSGMMTVVDSAASIMQPAEEARCGFDVDARGGC